MLIEFSVANFRSFRDRVTFSMVASSLKSKLPELNQNNLFVAKGKLRLLTSAALYGANAGGKSNLIRALAFMIHFVKNSTKGTERMGGIEVTPFRLNPACAKDPSFFEIVFLHKGTQYRYGFEATAEQVEAEWLYALTSTREALLFEREGEEINLGERFRAEGRGLAEKTRPNALFLSVAAQFDGKIAQSVLQWFRSIGIATRLDDIRMHMFTAKQLDGGAFTNEIAALVKRLDLGIQDVSVKKSAYQPRAIPDDAPDELRTMMETLNTMIKDKEQISVLTTHQMFDGQGIALEAELFELEEGESEGTQKLFAMAGPLIKALHKGELLVIDEMDARLHPLISREIVHLFNDPATNPHHAQLVFATHDTNLLDHRLLRRDQIWFVEKDRLGVSHLYSLAEFKVEDSRVRNDASFEKDYIQGRYGAVPFLGDLKSLMGEIQ